LAEIDFKNPDYLPIVNRRIERLLAIRKDKKKLAAAKVYYAANYADFISDWMVTYDPRKTPSMVPFILWPKQREYIQWLSDRYAAKEDGLVEKSRDAGATFLNAAFAVCLWTFEPGSKVSFGSRKEALVDKIGDTDTIFEKIRIILRGLPKEFLPVGYNELKHATYMKVLNPQNGSTITGEAGDNIGRGGRSGLYIKDESSHYERPELIDAALSQNSDVKIDVSTPNGNGNPFYKKRFGGKIKVFIFDWRDDPRKDAEWYQKQKDQLEPWILAQEVDRDYNASVENICIPARFVQAAVNLDLPEIGHGIAGLDVADEGGDANAFIARRGPKVYHVESWKEGDTTQTANRAIRLSGDHRVRLLNYDSIGVGAGVKGEFRRINESVLDTTILPHTIAVNVGVSPTEGMFNDRPNDEMFANLKAEIIWKLRQRFERTYEYVMGIKAWPVEDLISIPNNQELISELSRPLREITDGGKIKIESKKAMKKRGIPSPNLMDALGLAFSHGGESIPEEKRYSLAEPSRITAFVEGTDTIHPFDAPMFGVETYT